MIERMQVVGFQKHDELRVVFDPKVTTITGPSDTGKSSLLRALRWVVFNRPLGSGFVREGAERCSVRVWIDGRKIERTKTKSNNVYRVDGKLLKAVGTEVPEEVQAAFSMAADNFQGQHDAPYWFSLTPGEITKQLNRIVDLEVIDRSLFWLNSRLRKSRAEQEVVRDRLDKAREEQARLAYAEEMSEEFAAAKDQWRETTRMTRRQGLLAELLARVSFAAVRSSLLDEAVVEGAVVERAAQAVYDAHKRQASLQKLVEETRKARDRADRPVPNWNVVEEQQRQWQLLAHRRYDLTNLLESIQSHRQHAESLNEEAEKLEAKIKRTGICPLCGSKLK